MRDFLKIAIVIFTALIVSPAFADHQWVHDASFNSGYPDEGDGFLGTNKPVTQDGISYVWQPLSVPNWSFTGTGWVSAEFGPGTFGERDYGDEFEGIGEAKGTVDTGTPLKEVVLDFSAMYSMLPSFKSTNDDLILIHARLEKCLEFHSLTFTPYVQVGAWIGLGVLTTSPYVRPGFRLEWEATDTLSIELDAYRTFYTAPVRGNGTSFQEGYLTTNQATVTISKDMGNGLSLYANARFSQFIHSTFGFGATKTCGTFLCL